MKINLSALLLSFSQESLIQKYYATNILTSEPNAMKWKKHKNIGEVIYSLVNTFFDVVKNKANNRNMFI